MKPSERLRIAAAALRKLEHEAELSGDPEYCQTVRMIGERLTEALEGVGKTIAMLLRDDPEPASTTREETILSAARGLRQSPERTG